MLVFFAGLAQAADVESMKTICRERAFDATVVIKWPDDRTRAIFFRMGKPIGADTSQADGHPEFRPYKGGDLHMILIGNERYEIPDAVVLGG